MDGTDANEKCKRTVNFGQFPQDTKAQDIVVFFQDLLAGDMAEVEYVYAYGKNFGERGGARFRTSDAMRKYMQSHVGKHTHTFKNTKIYCNVDSRSRGPSSEDVQRERAVRKVVRALLEANG